MSLCVCADAVPAEPLHVENPPNWPNSCRLPRKPEEIHQRTGNPDEIHRNLANNFLLVCGKLKYPSFWGSPPFEKALPRQIGALQHVNWRPPKRKLTPSNMDCQDWRLAICSFCIELITQESPLPIYIMEGVNLHFGGWSCLGGCFIEKGRPQKGGIF